MRILLCSYFFAPSVGGLQTASWVFAEQFAAAGHDVTVVTAIASPTERPAPFRIVRQPRPLQLMRLMRDCDVVVHNNITLNSAWPLCFVRRPWVIVHQTWIGGDGGGFSARLKQGLKRLALRGATSVAISQAIADDLPVPAQVIPNPYDDAVFRLRPGVPRDRTFVFVGRLDASKGVAELLDAMANLRHKGVEADLTIVGGGPEEDDLRARRDSLGLKDAVSFAGVVQGDALAELLNRHRMIVVPSVWQEPFGIVALEGIACGCVAVATAGGGLKDAVGPCGVTVPNGDVPALTAAMAGLLNDPQGAEAYRAAAPAHLARHTPSAIARQYLDLFATVARHV